MDGDSPQMSVGKFGIKAVNTFIGVVGVVLCLTVLYKCARAVMEIGGACASGGAYEIRQPCPEGVGWMTPVSIFAGLVFLGWMIAWGAGLPGPKFAYLAWPALFLTLGYNFWDYGLDGPGDEGVVVGWIVCGVIFVLMGGLPLLAFKSRAARRATFWADAPSNAEGRIAIRPSARTVLGAAKPTFPKRGAGPTQPSSPPFTVTFSPSFTTSCPTGGDASTEMVGELQRLAAMHRAGELTDEEFAIAKQHILRAP